MITVKSLSIYPVKSTRPVLQNDFRVTRRGLLYDRNWAIIDDDGKVLTAREFPELLKISTTITKESIVFEYLEWNKTFEVGFAEFTGTEKSVRVFQEDLIGVSTDAPVNEVFSELLGVKCSLVTMPKRNVRPVLPRRGGKEGDEVSFVDASPVLLVSQSTVDNLNRKLDIAVSTECFRPNIVVEGAEPEIEDQWKMIRIGECEFEISGPCKRCVLTTLDPTTGDRRTDGEPLRTLAKYRKNEKGKVIFGVYMIPRKIGNIRLGDQVEIIRTF